MILLTLSLLLSGGAQAASCCGGGGSSASIITGDFSSTLALAVSYSDVIGDVDSDRESTFRHEKNSEVSQTLQIEGSKLLSDYWQISAMVPLIRKTREIGSQGNTESGLGDPTVNLIYEFLPETRYSAYIPRGFIFAGLKAPTSPSKYDFTSTYGEDIRGTGFWTPSLGLAFFKVRGRWDFQALTEIHQALDREFSQRDGSTLYARPSPGGSLLFGAGFSPTPTSPLRLGGALSPKYDGPVHLASRPASAEQIVWDTSASLSYMIDRKYGARLTYSDQTLFGPAQNTTLSRTLMLSLNQNTLL